MGLRIKGMYFSDASFSGDPICQQLLNIFSSETAGENIIDKFGNSLLKVITSETLGPLAVPAFSTLEFLRNTREEIHRGIPNL